MQRITVDCHREGLTIHISKSLISTNNINNLSITIATHSDKTKDSWDSWFDGLTATDDFLAERDQPN